MTVPIKAYRATSTTTWKKCEDGSVVTVALPPVSSPKPWFGHVDNRDRGAPHAGAGFAPFDAYLKDALTSPPAGAVGQFIHGYSGNSHPSTFASSAVSTAPALGVGAMLNTKLDWNGLANGTYDSLIAGFFNTWPVDTWGEVTVNHEPENEVKPASPTNSDWVAWANVNAPIWKTGINRYIDIAAPIIRSRGLNVKVGGVLMDFSWDTTRWQWWNWWDTITPANLGQVVFGADAYVKTVNGSPPVGYDLMPRINTMLAEARSVGITSFSLWETAVDRRERNNGNVLVGTEASTTAWWDNYYQRLQEIPEMRMVCYYHTPGGPASDQAYLTGTSIAKYADICMQGRRGA